MEEKSKYRVTYKSYLCSRKRSKTAMNLSEKQKAAHKLASDYLFFLTQQEAMMGRLFERKWKEIEPLLEQMIEQKIDERIKN